MLKIVWSGLTAGATSPNVAMTDRLEAAAQYGVVVVCHPAGDGERVAIEREQLGGDRHDVFLGDRPQLPRIALEVVGTELEQLRLEHHRGHAVRAFAPDLELANELVARELQIIVGGGAVADL